MKWLAGGLVAILLGAAGVWLAIRWHEESNREKPYHLIEERLYLGSSVGEPPRGTTAVVNLCGVQDPYPTETRFWEPILEGGAKEPDVAWLRRAVDFIDAQHRAGRTTYVHCLAGVNRSAMVVTAYLMFEHHWTRDEALTYVREKRPQAHPEPSMVALLTEWERTLQDRKK